jgi:hypothetical protein
MRVRVFAVLLLGLVGVAAVGLAAAPGADAYQLGGRPWPRGVIPYYNAVPAQQWAVREAARAWNTSGARVRFVAVPRSRARVIVKRWANSGCASHARATVGYVRRATVWISDSHEETLACNRFTSAFFVAHEFGHVLGLLHESGGCALMNPTGSLFGGSGCGPPALPYEWRCGLVERDDIAGAVKLYGGRIPITRSSPTCPMYDAISAPPEFAVTYRPDQKGIGLSFRRPASPAIPPFILVLAGRPEAFAFMSRRDSCPAATDVRNARRFTWSVPVEQATEVLDRLHAPGRYCYAVWALDGFGRPSAEPATAWVDIP